MKPGVLFSFFAAVAFHALLLFGSWMGVVAKPLPVNGEAASVTVNLVDSSPGSEAVAEATPETPPEPTPEPILLPAPDPEPTPAHNPEPSPDLVDTPAPQPTPVPSAKAAPSPKPMASRPAPKEKHAAGNATTHGLPDSPVGPVGNHGSGGSPLPRNKSNPKPDYPPEALRARHEGVALIAVDVSAEGRPTSVSLLQSSGFSELDQSALRTLWRWRFDPALRLGLPMASHVNIPIRFRLDQ